MSTGLTASLAKFVSNLEPEDVPAEAWPVVRAGFVDCIAAMAAGRSEPVVEILRKMLGTSGSDRGESVLCLDGGRATAPEAAWINGTASHALDYDDVALRGHPSAVLVPALLAEAEALDSSGREVATAYVAGYEVWADLVDRERGKHHDKGWHPTGIFGSIAAAAACARLRRLDARITMAALGIAASRSSGLMANFGTMTKPFHAGCAAHAGVVASRLAALGMSSAGDALEHPQGFLNAVSPGGDYDLRPTLAGTEWQIVRQALSIKKYPVCFASHRVIDASLDLVREHGITADQVEGISVNLSLLAAKLLRNALPQTGLEAKFSIQFAVASALICGNVGLNELTDRFVLLDEVQKLMQRVNVLTNENYDAETPVQSVWDQVHVVLTSGRKISSAQVKRPRGHPSSPLRQGELKSKFMDCMAAGNVAMDAEGLFGAMDRIDEAGRIRGIFGKR